MTKSLTLALMISLLSFLSLVPLGKANSDGADAQFYTSDGMSLSDEVDTSNFDF